MSFDIVGRIAVCVFIVVVIWMGVWLFYFGGENAAACIYLFAVSFAALICLAFQGNRS